MIPNVLNQKYRYYTIIFDLLTAIHDRDWPSSLTAICDHYIMSQRSIQVDINTRLIILPYLGILTPLWFTLFYYFKGYLAGVKKSCACTTIKRVTKAICGLAPEVITMPTPSEMRHSSEHFEARFGLPNFILGVDGTFVRLGLKPRISDLPQGNY